MAQAKVIPGSVVRRTFSDDLSKFGPSLLELSFVHLGHGIDYPAIIRSRACGCLAENLACRYQEGDQDRRYR